MRGSILGMMRCMESSAGGLDELIEFWTLLDEDRELLVGKRGSTALGFALLLKHFGRHGRFPRGRADLADAVVAFVARQLDVDAGALELYPWSGSTIEYHWSAPVIARSAWLDLGR